MLKILNSIFSLIKENKLYYSCFMITIASLILYCLSLRACPYDDFNKCSEYMINNAIFIGITLIISTILIAISTLLSIKSKNYLNLLCILGFVVYLNCFASNNLSFSDHEGANVVVLQLLLMLILMISLLLFYFKHFYSSSFKYLSVFLFFLFSYSIVYCSINYSKSLDCGYWTVGFKDSRVANDDSVCKIKTPNLCYNNLLLNLDLNKMLSLTCSSEFIPKDLKQEYYQDSDIAFFPNTAMTFTEEDMINLGSSIKKNLLLINFKDPNKYRNNLINGKISTDKNEIIKYYLSKGYEIYIDFTLIKPKLYQKVFKRSNPIQPPENLKVKNVIWIFIDAVSRVQFRKKLPKTFSFFESFYNQASKEKETFQFFKYFTHQPLTFVSAGAVTLGLDLRKDKNAKETVTLAERYRQKGFITGYSSEICATEVIDTMTSFKVQDNRSSYFNENYVMGCDPSLEVPKGNGEFDIKIFTSPYRRCLYGKDLFKFTIDYSNDFLETYKNEHKYLIMYLLDGHEQTQNVVKYLDDDLYNFLIKHSDDFDKDTAVVLYSDHGLQLNFIGEGLNPEDYKKEKMNPILNVLLPRKIADENRESLKYYENRLITPWDIHQLFLSFINEKANIKDKIVVDLFDNINKYDRDCKESGIGDELCQCES